VKIAKITLILLRTVNEVWTIAVNNKRQYFNLEVRFPTHLRRFVGRHVGWGLMKKRGAKTKFAAQ